MERSASINNPFVDRDGLSVARVFVANELADFASSSGECPALYPAGLLSAQALGRETAHERGWWLAHTRPRQEKAVASALFARSVGYFLPLVTRKSLTRGRLRSARIPLFPGYVFVHGDEGDRLSVLKTNRVVTVQPVPDGQQLRRNLFQFAVAIASGAPFVREARLRPGSRFALRLDHSVIRRGWFCVAMVERGCRLRSIFCSRGLRWKWKIVCLSPCENGTFAGWSERHREEEI